MATSTLPRRRQSADPRRALWMAVAGALLAIIAAAIMYGPAWCGYLAYAPQEGDVIFQSLPRGPLVNAIETGTHSPWSHCGIVARDEHGRWIVYEALDGVEATPLRDFLFRSRERRYAVYRWRDDLQPHIPQILAQARTYLGRPYDARYRMDDEAIYCSELIYKACRDATGELPGELVQLCDLDWQQHQPLIERLEGGAVPLDREMITPRDLAKAAQLEFLLESP